MNYSDYYAGGRPSQNQYNSTFGGDFQGQGYVQGNGPLRGSIKGRMGPQPIHGSDYMPNPAQRQSGWGQHPAWNDLNQTVGRGGARGAGYRPPSMAGVSWGSFQYQPHPPQFTDPRSVGTRYRPQQPSYRPPIDGYQQLYQQPTYRPQGWSTNTAAGAGQGSHGGGYKRINPMPAYDPAYDPGYRSFPY